MISKELLSEVLGHDDICNERIIQNKLLYMCKNDGMIDYEYEYNIYEFAHKCKEWAVNLSPNKHALSSYPRWGDIRNYKKTNGSYYICQHLVSGVQFEAETEPEAIFKACDYILKELSNK